MTAAELAYKTSATQTIDGDDLVMQELPQVYYIAARIRERLPQHVEMEDLVSAGVVGLIEAMKIFNEIQAGCSGVLVEILVENQQAVEHNQVLFRVDPSK